jgi:hypothetical protein
MFYRVDDCLFQVSFGRQTTPTPYDVRSDNSQRTTPAATPRSCATDTVGAISCLSFPSTSVATLGIDTSKHRNTNIGQLTCRTGTRHRIAL